MKHLVVPDAGQLRVTGDPFEPYQLLDPDGRVVDAVSVFLADLQAGGSPATTLRSYGMDLLRWWRFLSALGVRWDLATREEARDFARWMRLADKPVRVHWRHRGQIGIPAPESTKPAPGTPNAVTGKPSPGRKYAVSTQAHSETVLRSFYDFHLELGTGSLLINPFPLDRSRRATRANAHHGPLEDFKAERVGRYRPKVPKRVPRRIPDQDFDEIFAGLRSHRDRALLVFWVSTGARAEELLGALQHDASPGQQLIKVIRKGTREVQELPASSDAFVWLRLYQEETWRRGAPRGRNEPLWWTLRRPWRPLNYHAARKMFMRANELLGANWTLHDLRHTAAYRLARDPEVPLTHVQWILAHRYLTTTQLYLNPSQDEVIGSVLAHHARQERRREDPVPAPPAPGYNPASLSNLFGEHQ
ncbi:tyrosine-type recombinase/integrase [Kitasatospora sp. NPDC059408]|uniref:tyrosine-type recombinase/integrase n=1 Tax=Kitasatospora sp. NPDC059408 TaxID=3346823 RepID=UPI0036BE67B0